VRETPETHTGTAIITVGRHRGQPVRDSVADHHRILCARPCGCGDHDAQSGAGDRCRRLLCRAVAAQLADGKSFNDALHYANIAASICVQRMGAAPSMPSAAEVETCRL
jgi:hypothetical protein